MRVAIIDRPRAALDDAGRSIEGAMPFPIDVSDAREMNAVAVELLNKWGSASVVMNNAGIGGGGDALSDPEGWRDVIGVNLMGVLNGV